MKKLFLLALLPLVFSLSCSSSSDPDDTTPPVPPLAEETIGAEGGTLEIDDFVLTVPAGAFEGNQDLVLRLSDENLEDFGSVSRVFNLSGLPAELHEALQVRLGVEAMREESAVLMIGRDSFVKSRGEVGFAWQALEAERDGNFAVGTIPVYEGNLRADLQAEIGIIESDNLLSSGGHFRLLFHPTHTANASLLATYLEEAYDTFEAMGFTYAPRSRWPVHVSIKLLEPGTDGETYGSIFGDNYGSIAISDGIMSDHSTLRATAGHEFFHLVQAFYDPRSDWDRATEASRHYWLDEAAAVWSEELFSSNPNYVSSSRSGQVMEPFEGLQAGVGEKPDWHGYGCSAVIKYLVGIYGDEIVYDTFNAILADEHPVKALETASGDDIGFWWNGCLSDYYLGDLYGVDEIPIMNGFASGTWNVSAVDDTVKSFSDSYPALSGRIYKVIMNYSGMENNAEAIFRRSGPAPGSINVFKYKSTANAISLGSDPDSVVVSGIKDIMEDGYMLVAMVTNSREEAPEYVDETGITTMVQIRPGGNILEALQRSSGIIYGAGLSGGQHYFQFTSPTEDYTFGPENNLPHGATLDMPGAPFSGTYVALNFFGLSFSAELVHNNFTYQLDGYFSGDGKTLEYLTCVAQEVVEWDEGLFHLVDSINWSFEIANLELWSGYTIEANTCYLPYNTTTLSNLSGLSYTRIRQWVQDGTHIAQSTDTYLYSDWNYPMPVFEFTFAQY